MLRRFAQSARALGRAGLGAGQRLAQSGELRLQDLLALTVNTALFRHRLLGFGPRRFELLLCLTAQPILPLGRAGLGTGERLTQSGDLVLDLGSLPIYPGEFFLVTLLDEPRGP